jgi:hypothetical protein
MGRTRKDSSDPVYGQVASYYEVGNEYADSIKCKKNVD